MPYKKKALSKLCCFFLVCVGVGSSALFCSITMLFCSFVFLAELFLSQRNVIYYSYKRNPLFSGKDSDASQREAIQLIEIPAHGSRIQPDCNSSKTPSCLGILGISKNAKVLVGKERCSLLFGVGFFWFWWVFFSGEKKEKFLPRAKIDQVERFLLLFETGDTIFRKQRSLFIFQYQKKSRPHNSCI